jgi:Spy/CpxP family protein refolding chaperone
MKKMICLVAVVLLSTSAIFAQNQRPARGEKPDPTEMTSKMLEKMKEDLALSEDQSAQMKTILNDFHKEMPEAHQNGREAMETLANSRDAKVEKILTKDQYAKYTSILEEMKKERESRRGNRQRPPR